MTKAQSQQEHIYYYHTDHLGTPIMLTDSNQAIAWDATYDPFGKATVTTASVNNNLRFPGQYYDAETGLHYNWHRYYWPEVGRYVSGDPLNLMVFQPHDVLELLLYRDVKEFSYFIILSYPKLLANNVDISLITKNNLLVKYSKSLQQSTLRAPKWFNKYVYVTNNPVNNIDPLGLFEWWKFIKCIFESQELECAAVACPACRYIPVPWVKGVGCAMCIVCTIGGGLRCYEEAKKCGL